MRVIWSGPGSPEANMAEDARLLADSTAAFVLRFYTWQPTGLSLGHFQDAPPTSLLTALAGEEFRVVKRLTGGGAIVHADELTYSLSGPDGEGPFAGAVDASYAWMHEVLIDVFRDLGCPVEFAADAPAALPHRERPFLCFARSTALDLVARGRKIVGSAKRRRGGRALQHGSIILRAHPAQTGAIGLHELQPEHPIEARELAQRIAARIATILK
ncbi:MAG: hypothetical protein KDB53_17115 [Planctomycetes bacterium]|nr:hypothetical protein [Planctomycetota bacterium]